MSGHDWFGTFFLYTYIKCNLSQNVYINQFLIKCHPVFHCERLPILLTIFKSIKLKATDSVSLTIANLILPIISQIVSFFKFRSSGPSWANWDSSLDTVYKGSHVIWHSFKTKLHLRMIVKIFLGLVHYMGNDVTYIPQACVARCHI